MAHRMVNLASEITCDKHHWPRMRLIVSQYTRPEIVRGEESRTKYKEGMRKGEKVKVIQVSSWFGQEKRSLHPSNATCSRRRMRRWRWRMNACLSLDIKGWLVSMGSYPWESRRWSSTRVSMFFLSLTRGDAELMKKWFSSKAAYTFSHMSRWPMCWVLPRLTWCEDPPFHPMVLWGCTCPFAVYGWGNSPKF